MNETIIDVIGDQGVKKRSISSDLLNEIVLECSRDSSSRLLNYDDTKIDNFDLSSLCPENEGMFNNLSLNKLGFESSAGIEEVNSTENINIIPSNNTFLLHMH